jgi:hypothetical protein
MPLQKPLNRKSTTASERGEEGGKLCAAVRRERKREREREREQKGKRK